MIAPRPENLRETAIYGPVEESTKDWPCAAWLAGDAFVFVGADYCQGDPGDERREEERDDEPAGAIPVAVLGHSHGDKAGEYPQKCASKPTHLSLQLLYNTTESFIQPGRDRLRRAVRSKR